MAKQKFPQEGELVLATVKTVEQYGVFATLDDYPGCEGMIHISEVAAKWVKNIRDYATVGDKKVLKVLRVEPSRGHIDLSLKSVKENQKKQMLDAHKAETRAKRLIDIVCADIKTAKKEEILEKMESKFDNILDGLQATLTEGEKALEGLGLAKDVVKKIVEVAEKNIEKPRVHIKGNLMLTSPSPEGAKQIRDALVEAEKLGNKGEIKTVIKYISAPKYSIEVEGDEYKSLEKTVTAISDAVEKRMKAAQGTFEFQRSK